MKKEYLRTELERINNENIKSSTETILDLLPDYFYTMPASTSGKYHPLFSLGEGGLVRHIKVACKILEEMFKNESFSNYTEYEKDLIRMALILHDGFKSGKTYSNHTAVDHPLLMANFIKDNIDLLNITESEAEQVSKLISSHMGPWTKDRSGNEILPKPETKEELLVHLCDYIASRNFLNVYFENNEICDSVKRDSDEIKIKKLTK